MNIVGELITSNYIVGGFLGLLLGVEALIEGNKSLARFAALSVLLGLVGMVLAFVMKLLYMGFGKDDDY